MSNFTVARATLRHLGLTLRLVDGEYRVNFTNGGESTAYYTNDLEDAIETGRAMATEDAVSSEVPAIRVQGEYVAVANARGDTRVGEEIGVQCEGCGAAFQEDEDAKKTYGGIVVKDEMYAECTECGHVYSIRLENAERCVF